MKTIATGTEVASIRDDLVTKDKCQDLLLNNVGIGSDSCDHQFWVLETSV